MADCGRQLLSDITVAVHGSFSWQNIANYRFIAAVLCCSIWNRLAAGTALHTGTLQNYEQCVECCCVAAVNQSELTAAAVAAAMVKMQQQQFCLMAADCKIILLSDVSENVCSG